jgi:hypothetical protein
VSALWVGPGGIYNGDREGGSPDGLRVGIPMAEPATTTPAAAPERDALLATKLHLPRPRPGLVARPRLLQRLTEGMGRELVLVCTPAGFGKTTLLADWGRAGQRSVGWLSLDDSRRRARVLLPIPGRPSSSSLGGVPSSTSGPPACEMA